MTALDRLFWIVDEDGEAQHRLGAEWDGNSGPRWQWGRYASEADLWELSVGTTWSRWGLGVEVDWHRWSAWIADAPPVITQRSFGDPVVRATSLGQRVHYREQSATLTLGPLYVNWRRAHPAAEPDPASLR